MDFIKVLLEAGADITCKDKDDHTALYLVLMHSDSRTEEAICRLVEHGADVNTGFKNGSITTLTLVAGYGWDEANTAFLKRGAKTERKSGTSFDSPLGASASRGFFSGAKLLDDGANIEGKSYETETFAPPLYVAARNGQSGIVNLLLARGADIKGRDTVGEDTPLSIAVCEREEDIVKILLDHKANVNTTDNELRTPLHHACMRHQGGIVKMLLEYGANVDAQNNDLATLLSLACYVDSKDIIKILLKHNADVEMRGEDSLTPLHIACANGNADIVHMLLGRGAEIDAQSEGVTPLHAAAGEGYDEVVQIILEHNAGTHFKGPGSGSLIALEIALQEGHEKVVEQTRIYPKVGLH
jgi:ankyrin repeat protein